MPFPLILSVVVGGLNTLPGIGATLGFIIISLILLYQNFWLALKVLLACIVLQKIQDYLIAPIMPAVNINPVIIFFAILVGARVAGILGIFLAITIAGVVVAFFEIEEMKVEL